MPASGLLRIAAGVGCIASAAWLAAWSLPGSRLSKPAGPPPALTVVGSDVADLGVLRQGEPVASAFELRNDSKDTLTIHGVSSSCGCTMPTITVNEIPAGGTARVDVKYNTKGVRGSATQWLGVRYAEGQDKPIVELPLRIDAVVRPDYDVEPATIKDFSAAGETQELVVKPNASTSLSVTSVLADRAWFTVTHAPAGGPNSYIVRVTFDLAKYDNFAGEASLSIITNSLGQPAHHIPLRVTGRGEPPTPTAMPGVTQGGP